jgi:hypothetical protein
MCEPRMHTDGTRIGNSIWWSEQGCPVHQGRGDEVEREPLRCDDIALFMSNLIVKPTVTLATLLFACTVCFAEKISPFPGLPKLMEEADAIVILRVEEDLERYPSPVLYRTYKCCIHQTLKGDIQAVSRIALDLLDTRTRMEPPFAPWSTHLMFLRKKEGHNLVSDYRTLAYEGANIRLSPFGHEKLPDGNTILERIQHLIRKAIEYWDDQQKKEDEFLLKMLKP